jgi:orotidine 5'-phosphate decarboxylase subfamily 2
MDTRGPLCVGIDPHPSLLVSWGLDDSPGGLEQFGLSVVEALAAEVAVLKPQSAFFERHGSAGIAALERVVRSAREAGALILLDAKRGDIGSTMQGYADAYLEQSAPMAVDAMTVSPFLGFESLRPMLDTAAAHNAGVFVLALTSNPEGRAVQHARLRDTSVAETMVRSAAAENAGALVRGELGSVGLVVGATVGTAVQELELDLAALLALPLVERMVTLTCVSNEVGGDLAGNQVWRGALLRDLLVRARPASDADMVLSTSADGWTAGTPLDALTDPGRDAMLAVAMGGQPLPVEHGFPVRMVVPGLYGYVSATKWVVDLEVTRFDRAEGYWTPRGWSERGPVKTASRIDVPRDGADVPSGQVAVAGVAWAQHRGIRAVEVRVDEGPWQRARLGEGGNVDTWRQWVWTWPATPGEHTLQVRAIDGTGAAQTGREAPPAPNGATGWHTVSITVRS